MTTALKIKDINSILFVINKANHRAGRSQIQKCCLVAGTLGAAVSAMCQGETDQNLTALAHPADLDSGRPSYYPKSEMIDLQPVSAVRLLGNVFLDVGRDAVTPSFASNPYFSSYTLNLSDGFEEVAADTKWAWENLNLDWRITKRQHVFATYKSPAVVENGGPLTAGPMQSWTGVSANQINPIVEFPTIIGLGYGFKITDTISLETDIQWFDFSSDRSFDLSAENDPVLLTMGGKSASTMQKPRDIYASGIAGDWKFADHWMLQARYDFFENPGHNSAFSPTTPEVNQHVITFGVAWKGKSKSLEVAYAMDFYYDLHAANDHAPSFNGTYGFSGHLLSLAYRFTF